jgi:hypothetical protein
MDLVASKLIVMNRMNYSIKKCKMKLIIIIIIKLFCKIYKFVKIIINYVRSNNKIQLLKKMLDNLFLNNVKSYFNINEFKIF